MGLAATAGRFSRPILMRPIPDPPVFAPDFR